MYSLFPFEYVMPRPPLRISLPSEAQERYETTEKNFQLNRNNLAVKQRDSSYAYFYNREA